MLFIIYVNVPTLCNIRLLLNIEASGHMQHILIHARIMRVEKRNFNMFRLSCGFFGNVTIQLCIFHTLFTKMSAFGSCYVSCFTFSFELIPHILMFVPACDFMLMPSGKLIFSIMTEVIVYGIFA